MRRAAILGFAAVPVGIYQRTKDGRDTPLEHELAARVALDAFKMAGLTKEDVSGVVVAHPGDHTKQGYFHTVLTSYLGLKATSTVIQVLGNGMTGGHAFDEAVRLVCAGESDVVLSIGAHFESGVPTADHLDYSIRLTGDVDFQSIFGAVPISWYAINMHRYMHEHDVKRAQIAEVAVKNRRQASLNPIAQFRDLITLEEVLAQRMIVEPLGLLEVPGRADGAVAMVVVSEEVARAAKRPYVLVRSRGFYHEGEHQLSDKHVDMLAYESIARASGSALTRANMKLQDVSMFQIYSPCTIVEVLCIESIGLLPRGRGWTAATEGISAFDGARPVNTSGGHLSRGHPPEVTPMYDLFEACTQLLGMAGERQVRNPETCMTVSELGNYNAALAHILEAHP